MSDRVNARLLAAHLKPKAQRLLKHVEDLAGGEALLPDQSCEVVAAGEDYELRLSVCRRHRGLFSPPADAAPVAHVPQRNGKPIAPASLELKRVHQQILAKASPTEPKPAKKLIREAGYKVNSHSRAAVTELFRAGLLLRDHRNDYHLPPACQGQGFPG